MWDRLVDELAGRGWRVLASTTTKVGESVAASLPVVTMAGEKATKELDEMARDTAFSENEKVVALKNSERC